MVNTLKRDEGENSSFPMKIRHLRKFLPVGHGAFFVERLYVDEQRVLTAVYDCGDSNNGTLVQKYALQEFGAADGTIEKIDLLFISHFDDDHINGLQYIQPYLTSTTLTFLPFFYAHLQSVYDRKKRTGIPFVINILNQVNIQPILVHYRVGGRQNGSIDVDGFDSKHIDDIINSGLSFVKKVNGCPIWKFVPFNLFNEEALYKDFADKVKNQLGWNDVKLLDTAHWTKQDISDLRKIYNSFNRLTINDNSMMVLSDAYGDNGLYKVVIRKVLLHQVFDAWDSCPLRPSCLYTGDTVLKRGGRKSKYSDRYESFLKDLRLHTNQIALMQIPHHGSDNNINMSSLCDCLSIQMFCNYATSDIIHKSFMFKPTILDTLWKNIIKVTEDQATIYEQITEY